MTQTIVIVGANLAGGRAAATLRTEGFDGRVVLVGEERERPYERPPLSKKFLTGEVDEVTFFLQTSEFYEQQGIELQLGARAVALHADAKQVELAGGERLNYDQLLIATGASPRRLSVEGDDLDGVHYLRSIADARELRDQLQAATRVAVIGMGFIGAEIAATARTLGIEVVALEAADLPMLPLGREVAERLATVHREHGVDVRTGVTVTGLLGFDHAERVITTDGGVDCDLAVIGIGVVPEVGWLVDSGIEIDRGVVVDELCRTSLPDVFAAGDVTSSFNPRYGRHMLVEHFDNAANQGVAAARSMLGTLDQPYAPLPYFWSDQYDLSIQVAGLPAGCDRVIFRGTVESGSWSAFYLHRDTFRAALSVNRFKDFSAARRLLTAGTPVSAEQLADETFELKTLVRRG